MRKTILLTLVALATTLTSFSQAPEAFKYQAVVRDAGGAIITNQTVGYQLTILQGSASGTSVYIETFSPMTNGYGLVNLEIGTGTTSDDFALIDWANGPYFMETAADVAGGTAYVVMGTSQLLSVPYALYAKNSGSSTPGPQGVAGADGAAGATGTQGLTGPQGAAGPQGIAGNVGATGLTGPQGMIGLQGAAGPQGVVGNDGATGLTGADGAVGPQGVAGPTGAVGPQGPAGADGVTLGNTLDLAYDQGGAGAGRIVTVDAGEIEFTNGTVNGIALRTSTTNTGVGVMATSVNSANGFSPIQANTNASSTLTSAIVGSSSGGASGVSGQVESTATAAQGIYGNNLRTSGGYGSYGIGHTGTVGETNYQLGYGTYGRNYNAIGPLGNSVGAYGLGYVGVWGDQSDVNGYSVYANGDFGAAGTKAFAIDHPLDPEHKYLKHYSIESNEVLNMYRGTIPFDGNGEATVTMPDYFNAVNANFSYQLTPIGGYAPLFIKEKLNGGKFVIAGGTPGMEVSWTVYAERNDPYLQQHPESKSVEVNKEEWNQGKYLQPDLYGQPDSKRIVKPLETGKVTIEGGVEQKSIELIKK